MGMVRKLFFIFILIFIIACTNQIQSENKEIQTEVVNMKLTSPAFQHNGQIPSEYTCDGSDISPELIISDVPSNAKSLVLINDDPDAPVGTWDHWVIFNIPTSTTKISKGTEPNGVAGRNSWGRTGYGGPCPPSGTHRYFFKLYALDVSSLPSFEIPPDKAAIEKAMQGHIIAQAELMGTYKRNR